MSRDGGHDIYRTAGSGHQLILCHIVAFFVAIGPRHYWQIVEAVQRLGKPGLGGSCGQKKGLSHRAEGSETGEIQRPMVCCNGAVVELHAPTGVGGSQRQARRGEISPHTRWMKFRETAPCQKD